MSDDFDPSSLGFVEENTETHKQAQPAADVSGFDPSSLGFAEVGEKKEKQTIGGAIKGMAEAMWDLTPGYEEMKDAWASPYIAAGPWGIAAKLMMDKPQRFDMALETGAPLVVQGLTAPLQAVGVGEAISGATSAIANSIVQGRRMLMDEQEGFSMGEVAQSAMLGAVPVVGAAGKALKSTRPLLSTAKATAKTAGMMAGAGAAGQVVRTAIDERPMVDDEGIEMLDANGKPIMTRIPDMGQVAVSAAVPAIMAVSMAPISFYGARNTRVGRDILTAAQDVPEGVRPSYGMIDRRLAKVEQRIAQYNPDSSAARGIQQAYGDLENLAGSVDIPVTEAAAMHKELSPLLKTLPTARETLDTLGEAAKTANKAVDDAYDEWINASAKDYEFKKQKFEEANALAFAENANAIVENAKFIAQEKAIGKNPVVMDAASARELAVDGFAKPLEANLDSMFNGIYKAIEKDTRTFDTAPLESIVSGIRGKYRSLSSSGEGAMKSIENLFPGGKVSLAEARMVRTQLFNRLRGAMVSEEEKNIIREAAHGITQMVDEQAPTVLGKEKAALLKAVNADYRRKIQLFEANGVDALFDKNPTGNAIEQVIGEMVGKKQGLNSERYGNLVALSSYLSEFNPTLGASTRESFHDALRSNILFKASVGNEATGRHILDFNKLADTLNKLGATDGAIEALGFGNREIVNDLRSLSKDYPAAKQMTMDEFQTIMRTPVFQDAVNRAGGVKMLLDKSMADSQAKVQLYRAAIAENMQDVNTAAAFRKQAERTLDEADGNVAEAQKYYDKIKNDPDLQVLDNPNISDAGIKEFNESIMGTNFEHPEAKAIMDAVRNKNPKLAQQLEEYHIANLLSTLREASPLYFKNKPFRPDVEKLAKLGDSPDTAIQTAWERLKAVTTPETFEKVEELVDGASSFVEYKRLGGMPEKHLSEQAAQVGSKAKGLNWIQNLWYTGRYKLAARELSGREEAMRLAVQRISKGKSEAMAVPVGTAVGRVAETQSQENEKASKPSGRDALRVFGQSMATQP